MKKKLKKLNLKKQTLQLLTGSRLMGGQENESRVRICPITSINQCPTQVSCDSLCPSCWA